MAKKCKFKLKRIGRKDKRYTIRFPDGTLASNRRFKNKSSAEKWKRIMCKL